MKKPSAVLFRVDAGRRWGNGHLMRCFALAQSLRRAGVRVTFVSRIESAGLKRGLRRESIPVMPASPGHPGSARDARYTAATARRLRASWVVLDGHPFSLRYQQRLGGGDFRRMLIDDHGKAPCAVDLILNQNLHAGRALYACAPGAALLLGPRYAQLRPEFERWRNRAKPIAADASKILITMGGSDPEDTAGKALRSIAGLDRRLDVIVVIGEHYLFGRRLFAEARKSPHRVRITKGTDRMAKFMAWADLSISTFGTTSWEMAFMGLPSVSLVVEDHQKPFARAMAREGALVKIDRHVRFEKGLLGETVGRVLQSRRERERMSRRGRALVDGLGGERVLRAMGLSRRRR